MSTPIKTNQLKVDIDIHAYENQYDIFEVVTSDKYFRRGAEILDTPLLCNGVLSLYFVSGKRFYVLMDKHPSNKTRLKKSLQNTPDGDNITFSFMPATSVEQRILISLLLNALSSYELEFLRCNNLSGHFYCFHPKWIRKRTKGKESIIETIMCLELSVTEDLRLALSVRTFTSERLKHKIVFKKRTFEQYPKYVLAANHCLRRKLKQDTEECFILRKTIDDKKSSIPFMHIQNIEKFETSKMGVLAHVFTLFNEKYQGICNLQFQAISEYTTIETRRSMVEENNDVVLSLLQETSIKIIDLIRDAYSAKLCLDIQSILETKYQISVSIGKRISKNALNLCVIHNALYYQDGNDPHDKDYNGAVVQHITLEDFELDTEAQLRSVFYQLIIKQDIIKKRFSLFGWNLVGMTGEISFGMRTTIQEEDRYFFMTIQEDGSFSFEEQTLDLFSFTQYTDCVNIFSCNDDVIGVIRYPDGGINIIKETNWFTIPEIESLYQELSSGNTYLRGKEKRDALLSAITDIRGFYQGDSMFYFVGKIGYGMKTEIEHAANIRKIEPYKNTPLRFEELLPLMNVSFVRNGQLTVMPFPFKYLREYISSL